MKKNQEALLLASCCKGKKSREEFRQPSQFGNEIVASDIHRLTIISGEAPDQYRKHVDFPSTYRVPCPPIPDGGIVIDGKELADELKSAKRHCCLHKETEFVLMMESGDGYILFTAENPNPPIMGEHPELDLQFVIPCDTEGKPCIPRGAVNGQYLLEAAICLDTFELSQQDSTGPLMLKSGNLEHYIMPLRV